MKDAFRTCLGHFATGVTVVTTQSRGKVHGMTVNAFMSGSAQPPLVVVAVSRAAKIHGFLQGGGCFGVNILNRLQEGLGRHFAGETDPLLRVLFKMVRGVPILPSALAWIVARVVDTHPCGDHTLFIGAVEHLAC